MILCSISPAAKTKGLVMCNRAARQLNSATGNIKRIFMPVNNLLVARQTLEKRVVPSLLGQLYAREADLGHMMGTNRCTQCMCQQLTPKAKPEVRDILLDCPANGSLNCRQVRIPIISANMLRPAHGDESIILRWIGNRCFFIHLDNFAQDAVFLHDLAQVAR